MCLLASLLFVFVCAVEPGRDAELEFCLPSLWQQVCK